MSPTNLPDFKQPGGPDPRRSARIRAACWGGVALLLSASTLAMAPRASAEVPRVTVSYRGLDLTTPEGVSALGRRVVASVRGLCLYPLYGSPGCVAEALEAARPQMARAIRRATARGRAGPATPH